MRKFLFSIICFLFYNCLFAQDKLLVAEGTAPDLYLTHAVTPKENYYSVGRLYNISPKELAPYNNLVFEKGLSLGQTIKIPLKLNNFSQGESPKENEVLIPVYHVVQPKEGLYRISVNYNKVPLDLLKKWNNLSGDIVSNGTKLIVGYLKVIKDQSSLASQAVKVAPSEIVKSQPEKKPKNIAATQPKKNETVIKEPEKPIEQKTKIVEKTADDAIVFTSNIPVNFSGGKFKKLYTDQAVNKSFVNENGVAATFKTTSGWQDGKYYCFHNNATPGTIIKVTNNANGKSIYAKVLDAIPDIKQNGGLLIRISNSAAEELGVTESKFDCQISYPK
ncbi:MAG: LysM peptidoglycan-binding domain-containing protein [Bacteroidota bacterium]|nr:LysM peptidoglycan-binding domain-containing protein [Bacteroidota bacterium]